MWSRTFSSAQTGGGSTTDVTPRDEALGPNAAAAAASCAPVPSLGRVVACTATTGSPGPAQPHATLRRDATASSV